MPLARSTLSLVKTGVRPREFELREDGRALGSLRLGPGRAPAEATVGHRSWTLTPGACRSSVDALAADGGVGAALRAGHITLAGDRRPFATWRRNRTVGACAELAADGSTATLRIRRRTAPGLDVSIDGDLLERELLVLLAGYDLLR
ncbi:unannotated protein [freshwater metagenome]|uniref:Unannotated protein n=1 Tax=freshwater metagenome TaxID=449393 RepID=A0A6J7IMF3_9ZZZZ